ncbi:MAG: nucleotidyltransferase family protein [Nanoarchaeota archaeon]|nr:nucleotidyltransferase family protein [Nanoarchaeota archaeon]MBU1644042.1 nucleotidyltransferase family protein [Nanoarchaeota archaeon]MBU1977284.1 nucleotidyltransferase family protein [Nanoarchaeota archaeon]
MKLTQKSIIKELEAHKEDICKYDVKKIALFGSYLKGKQHQKSDIDFLVSFSKPSFDNYMELKFLLEKIFKKKIDLVTEKSLKPALKYVKEEAIYAKVS